MKGFHLKRRTDVSIGKRALYYVVAILISLGIGALLLSILGIDPWDYYSKMLTIGAVGNRYAYKSFEGLLKIFVPLLITSLALALAFKMRFWNVGGEGQFIVGALAAGFVAYKCEGLPNFVTVLLMSVAAFLCSGLIGLWVAHLKVRFNTNETLVTLMLNYIFLYLITFVGDTKADWNFFLREDSERPIFGKFPENSWMGGIKIGDFTLLYSVLIAAAIAVIIYFYLKKTKQGYEISVVGDSAETARYAGIKVAKTVVRTMFLSAALIGLAGAFTASTSQTLSTSITNNVGWTGVIVAWLSKLSVPAICVTSILISILQYGCQAAAVQYPSIDTNFADLLQGIILFSVLIADFIGNFQIVRRKEAQDA